MDFGLESGGKEENGEDLRVLYAAQSATEAERPEWRDVTFENLGCKYYRGEWSRLRMFNGLLY